AIHLLVHFLVGYERVLSDNRRPSTIQYPDGRHLIIDSQRASVWSAERYKLEQKHLQLLKFNDDGMPAPAPEPLADDEGEVNINTPPNGPLFDEGSAEFPPSHAQAPAPAAQPAAAAFPPPPPAPSVVYNTYYQMPGSGPALPPQNPQQQQPPQQQQQLPPSSSATEYENDDFHLFLDTGSYKSKPGDKEKWQKVLEEQEIGAGEFEAVSENKWEETYKLPGGSVVRLVRAFAAFKTGFLACVKDFTGEQRAAKGVVSGAGRR
ncbi:hypothetical protein JCM5296_006731, partial [Sporobolomyces johnsonii]